MKQMGLSEFISQVIADINAGIVDAINRAESAGSPYKINPIPAGAEKNWQPYTRNVEFDIALTVEKSGDVSVGFSLYVFTPKVGAQGKTSSAHRVRFAIPVVFSGQSIEGSHSP